MLRPAYSPSFSPTAPVANGVAGSDDLVNLTTSGFAAEPSTGTTCVFVNTGFSAPEFGFFSNTIGGPGVETVVPEVSTYAKLALGLAAVELARQRKLLAR